MAGKEIYVTCDGRVEKAVDEGHEWYAVDYHIEPSFSLICPIPRYLLPKKFWKPL